MGARSTGGSGQLQILRNNPVKRGHLQCGNLHMDHYSHGNDNQTGKKMKKQQIQMAGHIYAPLQVWDLDTPG